MFAALLSLTLLLASASAKRPRPLPDQCGLPAFKAGKDTCSAYGRLKVIGKVQRLPWPEDDPSFALKVLKGRSTPAVFTGTPADRWAAMSKWSPEYLVKRFGSDKRVSVFYASTGNYLYQSTDKAKKFGPGYIPPTTAKRMPLKMFMRQRGRPGRPKLYYNMLAAVRRIFVPCQNGLRSSSPSACQRRSGDFHLPTAFPPPFCLSPPRKPGFFNGRLALL